jgi:hexosaminidase
VLLLAIWFHATRIMRARLLLAIAAAGGGAAAAPARADAPLVGLGVWPAPRSVHPGAAWDAAFARPGARSDSPPVAPVRRFVVAPDAPARLARGAARYNDVLARAAPANAAALGAAGANAAVDVVVRVTGGGDASEADNALPGPGTDYSYTITAGGSGGAAVTAPSVYGALYGMETAAQLVGLHGGLPAVDVSDAPMLAWRGLMLDSGRRFFNVSLVQNILDTMAAAKMNVLHWHLADDCRWAVQSAKYPATTSNLTGDYGGFNTPADVATIVAYAGDRGIRVVPEFDTPGHSRGLLALGNTGDVVFCEPDAPTRSQLYGDPGNVTLATVSALYTEMAALFPDPVFHVGADETSAQGPCTTESTFGLERELLAAVVAAGKTPAGWEEMLFDAGAATPGSIIYAWNRDSPAAIIAAGHPAVDSSDGHWYFTSPAGAFPGGWAACWADARAGVPAQNLSGLLGAEASMWTDTYCITDQCGASTGAAPPGSPLFPPSTDGAFGPSVGGMIWPRGFVAAGAFYNFNASLDPTSPAFEATINALSASVAARGGFVCPVGCACDQLTACGKPYIPVPPPAPGSPAHASTTCVQPFPPGGVWVPGPGIVAGTGAGTLALAANASLCLAEPPGGGYPLTLAPCAGATTWSHPPSSSELVSTASGLCMDIRTSDGVVGTYACGSGSGDKQPNQEWAVDGSSGLVLSLDGGACLQVG